MSSPSSVASDPFGVLCPPLQGQFLRVDAPTQSPRASDVIFPAALGMTTSFYLLKCSLPFFLPVSLQPPRLTSSWIFLNVALNVSEGMPGWLS